MFTLFNFALGVHIVSGFTALILGTVLMLLTKGNNRHRKIGRWFALAMLGVCLSSWYMSIAKANWFLLGVGCFSAYLTASGFTVMPSRQHQKNIRRLITAIAFYGIVAGILLLSLSIAAILSSDSFGIVPAVFGLLCLGLGLVDLMHLLKPIRKPLLLIRSHALRMSGAYAATLTAFIVVNVQINMQWVLWILPAAIIVPIARKQFQRQYLRKAAVCVLLSVAFAKANAQDSVYTQQGLSRSTKFAWTTYGADMILSAGGQTATLQSGQMQRADFNGQVSPRFTIGGIHFWGHADFYVHFPLNILKGDAVAGLSNIRHRTGIETGARVYPWKLKQTAVRPFVGISFRQMGFSQEKNLTAGQEPAKMEKMIMPINLGLSYVSKQYIFTAGAYYQRSNRRSFTYYNSAAEAVPVSLNPWSVHFGIVRYIDTDAGMRTAKGLEQANLKHQLLKKYKKLSSWYWAVGPSAALKMSASPYLQNKGAYLNDDFIGSFVLDLGFGRYFSKPDANLGISYRSYGDRVRAFDTDIRLRRNSLMLEAYKFLFDYHGFVPYLGATISAEQLSVSEKGQNIRNTKAALGLIAGWDIRVTKTNSSLLRTNLRYIPNLHMQVNGQKLYFDQLEFNFIQYVHFIGRKKFYQSFRSK